MQVTIDWDLCIGSGMCRDATDGAFDLTATPAGPRAQRTGVACSDSCLLDAATACPTLAIRLVEDTGREVFPGDRGVGRGTTASQLI